MQIGLYSVTYRGVWYGGPAIDAFSLMRLAKEQGWEGVELDCDRPHLAPMDFSSRRPPAAARPGRRAGPADLRSVAEQRPLEPGWHASARR